MIIKRNIYFAVKVRRDSKGNKIETNLPIRMRVSYNWNYKDFYTGYNIDLDKWDEAIFEPAEMRDYLEILNICISQKTLKIKENKIRHPCAVIYALYTHSSEDRSYLDGWESRIVEKLKIDPNTYKQRKSDIKNGQASESLLSFYNGLSKILTTRN